MQDNATIHVGYGVPAILGDNVTVGHNAVVHGCTVGSNVIVGMGSILLDGAKIGDNCIIGAGTLIPGRKEIPAGSLVFGNPYRIVRALSEQEKAEIAKNAEEYVRLSPPPSPPKGKAPKKGFYDNRVKIRKNKQFTLD